MSTKRKAIGFHKVVYLSISILMIFSMVIPRQAQAATLIVNTLLDENDGSCSDGDCSLRDAIQVATAGDSISFTVNGTIVLNQGPLFVEKNLTISGPGLASLTIDGNHATQIFYITAGNTDFSDLTIANGSTTGVIKTGGGMYNTGTTVLTNVTFSGNSANYGGGIYNSGLATLTNVTFSGNSAVYEGGGLFNSGTATMTNVTISGNYTSSLDYDGGGGMYSPGNSTLNNVTFSSNSAGNKGGGMFNYGTTTLTNVTFSDNSAKYTGGMASLGTATLMKVTFSGNSAYDNGGGMYNEFGTATLANVTFSGNSAGVGGGMKNGATATLTNVTFSGNTATYGGGMNNTSGVDTGTSMLTNVTFSGNTATSGGGGMLIDSFTTSTLTNVTFRGNSTSGGYGGGGVKVWSGSSLILKNTLLAGGEASTGPDCSGTLTSYGYNLIEDTSGCTIMGEETGNIYGEDPLLGPLGHYGGYTLSHALLTGSPAIDAASSTDPSGHPVILDQRGVTRPQGSANDIGSFEYINQVAFWLPVILK